MKENNFHFPVTRIELDYSGIIDELTFGDQYYVFRDHENNFFKLNNSNKEITNLKNSNDPDIMELLKGDYLIINKSDNHYRYGNLNIIIYNSGLCAGNIAIATEDSVTKGLAPSVAVIYGKKVADILLNLGVELREASNVGIANPAPAKYSETVGFYLNSLKNDFINKKKMKLHKIRLTDLLSKSDDLDAGSII